MHFDFREHGEGVKASEFLARLEAETMRDLATSRGNPERLKSTVFFFCRRAHESYLPDDKVIATFRKALARAGYTEAEEPSALAWFEHYRALVRKGDPD